MTTGLVLQNLLLIITILAFAASRHAGPYPIFPLLAELYLADYPGPVGGYPPDLPQV
jgi:hypothetical protein